MLLIISNIWLKLFAPFWPYSETGGTAVLGAGCIDIVRVKEWGIPIAKTCTVKFRPAIVIPAAITRTIKIRAERRVLPDASFCIPS